MPEDKGKSVKAPKSKSNDDFAPQLVKSKSEIPKNAVLKIDSDGGEYWEVETKHEETKKKMYPPSSGKKRTGTPRKKDPEKSSTFGSTIQRYKLPPPEVIPPKQTGLYGSVSTYEKIDPAAQWGADYGITTFTFPDEYGRYTNTSRTTNIDKEGREIAYDLANPLNSFKDGKFTPTLTGRTIDDVRNEWSLVGMSKPTDYSGNKANPDYKGSLMMPGTKATRVAGGGGGEFNQRNIANIPNALDKVPIGYIEQKYDTQGNPIVTPNVGVQMDTKNITPLRKGEMEVGRMYNIENPIEIKGKFAKGGVVSKIKGYYDGGPVYNPNMNIDGTYGDSNSSYKPIDTFGSGVVGMNDQYTAQNNMQAKKAIDENKKKANQQKTRGNVDAAGNILGGVGSAYYASQQPASDSENIYNQGMGAVSKAGAIGGVIGGIAAVGDAVGAKVRKDTEAKDLKTGKYKNIDSASGAALVGMGFNPFKAQVEVFGDKDVSLGTKLKFAAAHGLTMGLGGGLAAKSVYKDKEAASVKRINDEKARINDANRLAAQQQAILDRNNNEENGSFTNPYNANDVAYNEQGKVTTPMMNKGGVVGKIKNMYADGGDIKGKGTAKSDSIMAEVKEGSFVVPAENAELAKGIRKLYLKAPNKKANLKQEEGEAVKLSNGEHLFTPEENEYLESIGIDLETLAPNAEEGNEKVNGGLVKGTKVDGATWDGKNWVSENGSKYSSEGGKKFTDKYNQSVAKEKSNQEQKRASEINLYSRKLKEATDNGNTEEAKRLQAKINELSGTKKTETKPTVVTENVPTTKPSLKAPKVKASKVTVDTLPTKDLSLQGLKEDAELKVANQAAMQEASIANAPTRQAVINDANITSNENYLAAKPKSKNAWANKLSNIDPTAFVGIGQAALGLNMLGKEKRPIDKAVIDPTYNAAVNRAQQDALFGLTPEQRFMAEQDIQGGLNDAKMAGLNASGVQSFNLNRAAINDAWRNKLGLKQADAEMRMNKQKYADVMATDRANILAANRRQAYNDAMNTFQQKQQAGSELIGAGLANTIDAYRFNRSMQQRDAAEKQKTDFVNKI